MGSDLIVKEFYEWRSGNSGDLQSYFEGENEWKLPIKSTDIVFIGYISGEQETVSYGKGISGIILIHKIPAN